LCDASLVFVKLSAYVIGRFVHVLGEKFSCRLVDLRKLLQFGWRRISEPPFSGVAVFGVGEWGRRVITVTEGCGGKQNADSE
jgi:hypothetical protein